MGVNVRSSAFGLAKEARTQSGFFKFVHGTDLSSEKMREIPQDLVTELTSFTMVLTTVWGMSWEVELLKNPRFCYMEKQGWDKFVSDNALGDSEFVTFTHKGDMSFKVTIFKRNGTEMIKPPPSMASSFPIKSEEEQRTNVNSTRERAAESTGGAATKRELNSGKKKVSGIDSAGPSSSSAPKFVIVIKDSHKYAITIPKLFVDENQLLQEERVFKINHPNGKKSWKVKCVCKNSNTVLSKGWSKLYLQYPLSFGDICEITLTTPTEMVLVVVKAGEETS